MSKSQKDVKITSQILLLVLSLILISSFFVTVNAGERGVRMQFGKVENRVLGEGLHFIIPLVNTVEKLSVRVQKQDISAEASSKDLQEVFSDVSLNWHILPDNANTIYQRIGNIPQVVEGIINPAVEEILKAVMAKYTAEEIIIKREQLKAEIDSLLQARLSNYQLAVDDISLLHFNFSQRFKDAVETKQIAEQEAKRTGFMAEKAIKEGQIKVNLARGEAEAQRLLKENLTPEILQKQFIDKWNGNLPLIVGDKSNQLIDLNKYITPEVGVIK